MGQLGIGNITLCILWFQGHIQHPQGSSMRGPFSSGERVR